MNPPVDLDTPAIEVPYEFRRAAITELLPEDLALARATATLVLHTEFSSARLFGKTSVTCDVDELSELTTSEPAPDLTADAAPSAQVASPDQLLSSRSERENRTRLQFLARMYARKNLTLDNEDQARLDIATERITALLPRVTATAFERLAARLEKLGPVESRLAARRAARK